MQRNTLELHFAAGATGHSGMLGLVPIPNQGGRLRPSPDRLIPTNRFDIPAVPFLKYARVEFCDRGDGISWDVGTRSSNLWSMH